MEGWIIACIALALGSAAGLVLWCVALEGRVKALEATLRERGIYPPKELLGGAPYDPPRNHRAGPVPRYVGNLDLVAGMGAPTGYRPQQPTSRPSGPAPELPPNPTGRV